MPKYLKSLLAIGLIGGLAAPAAAQDSAPPAADQPAPAPVTRESGWQFSSGPYLWMAGLKGDMGVSEAVEPVAVDLSFFDILDALKFAFMSSSEVRNGRFVGTSDLIYLSMGATDDISVREVAYVDAELKSKTLISTLTVGYRVVENDRVDMDAFVGIRNYRMKTTLDLVGPNNAFSGSEKESWVDPIVGIRVKVPLDERWSLHSYGDIGGFGAGSDLSWQVSGVIRYEMSDRWSLHGGWRHLDVDYEKSGFVFDAAMDGPILGVVRRF